MEGIIIARKLREWYPGAKFHICARGIRRQDYGMIKRFTVVG